jgi:hypothetical protein
LTHAGFDHGSLRKIHPAVKSWNSQTFMWIGSLKIRSK